MAYRDAARNTVRDVPSRTSERRRGNPATNRRSTQLGSNLSNSISPAGRNSSARTDRNFKAVEVALNRSMAELCKINSGQLFERKELNRNLVATFALRVASRHSFARSRQETEWRNAKLEYTSLNERNKDQARDDIWKTKRKRIMLASSIRPCRRQIDQRTAPHASVINRRGEERGTDLVGVRLNVRSEIICFSLDGVGSDFGVCTSKRQSRASWMGERRTSLLGVRLGGRGESIRGTLSTSVSQSGSRRGSALVAREGVGSLLGVGLQHSSVNHVR